MNELMKLRDELVELRDNDSGHYAVYRWQSFNIAIERIDAAITERSYHSLRLAGYSE